MKRGPEASPPVGRVLQRTLAGILSATILLLTVFAVAPGAHAQLHSDVGDPQHTCAITLFAQGITTSLGPIDLPTPRERSEQLAPAAAPELRLISPRYLRKPLRGPPAN